MTTIYKFSERLEFFITWESRDNILSNLKIYEHPSRHGSIIRIKRERVVEELKLKLVFSCDTFEDVLMDASHYIIHLGNLNYLYVGSSIQEFSAKAKIVWFQAYWVCDQRYAFAKDESENEYDLDDYESSEMHKIYGNK